MSDNLSTETQNEKINSKGKSQFEIALDQKELIIRQEYEIGALRKKIDKILK